MKFLNFLIIPSLMASLSDLNTLRECLFIWTKQFTFSDYSFKKRFIYLPEGKKMTYREKEVLHLLTKEVS